MLNNLNFIFIILQLGGCIFVNYAIPVTNFDSGNTKSDTFVFELPKSQDAQSLSARVSSLSASGRSYGDTSIQNQPADLSASSSSASGRILSQSSSPDKDAITYPDDISRDSYGNIVTPYTTLVDGTEQSSKPKPAEIGVLTDVSKDKGTLQFVIPSYADGITQLQGPYKPKPSSVSSAIAPPLQTLLPPLSSGNYNYPSLTSVYKPTADNSYQNEIGGSFSSAAPAPTGPTAITTNEHIGSANNSPNIFNPNLQIPFSSSSAVPGQPIHSNEQQSSVINILPQSLAQPISGTQKNSVSNGSPFVHGSNDFSAIQVSSSPELNAPSSTFPILSNVKPQKNSQVVNQVPIQIQTDNGKYTGGFGGGPGILGEQKTLGYAVKPSVNKNPSTGIANKPASAPNSIPPQTLNTQSLSNTVYSQGIQNTPSALNQAPPKPVTLNHGSFQFGSAISPQPALNTQLNNYDKYTGPFGGPPGILAPFDNVKTGKATDSNSSSNIGPQRKY